MIKNNILSYFIKDIKDPIELDKYIQYNNEYYISIIYNNTSIYRHNTYYKYIYNYITNISKVNYLKHIYTNRICINKIANHKSLFYKKDNKVDNISSNYIGYTYIYLCKTNFLYRINNNNILYIIIRYYNRFKYIYYNDNKIMFYKINRLHKYKSQILIMNKYELQYISRFLYLYFDN